MKKSCKIEIADYRRFGHFWLDNQIVTVWARVIGPTGLAVCAALAAHEDLEPSQDGTRLITVANLLGLELLEAEEQLTRLCRLGLVVRERRPGKVDRYSLPSELPPRKTPSEWDDSGALGGAGHE